MVSNTYLFCGCEIEYNYLEEPHTRWGEICWWHRSFSKRQQGDKK